MILANIKRHTSKKLLKDCCTKDAFDFNSAIYEQIDETSIKSCLETTFLNIIIDELEIKWLTKILHSLCRSDLRTDQRVRY